jgi:phage tail sheath gpL-like
VFRGNNATTVEDVTDVTAERSDDRVNVQLIAEGSPNLPFVIAARQLARIAKVANDNPPRDYGSQRATGLIPGADEVQFNYTQRDAIVKGGSSTTEVRDGVVNVSDVVTSYAPEGEVPPAYRFVCDVVKLQQVIYNFKLKFQNADWDGAPMIPDNQPTVNPSAKKPKMWIAAANGILDALGLQAILSDVETAKTKTTCTQDPTNPKRYNASVTIQLGGNANIGDLTLNWGFFFGTPEVVG